MVPKITLSMIFSPRVWLEQDPKVFRFNFENLGDFQPVEDEACNTILFCTAIFRATKISIFLHLDWYFCIFDIATILFANVERAKISKFLDFFLRNFLNFKKIHPKVKITGPKSSDFPLFLVKLCYIRIKRIFCDKFNKF